MKLPLIVFIILLSVIFFLKWRASRPKKPELPGSPEPSNPPESKKGKESGRWGGVIAWVIILAIAGAGGWYGYQYYTHTKNSLMSLPLCGGATKDFSGRKAPAKIVVKFYTQCRTRVKLPEWTRFTLDPSETVRMKFLNSSEFKTGPDSDHWLGKGVQRFFNVSGVEKPGKLEIVLYKKIKA